MYGTRAVSCQCSVCFVCPYLRVYKSFILFSSSAQRGGAIRESARPSFEATLSRSLARITGLITSKLDQFFELSEYEWTPRTRESAPSMYLYELVNWLTTVVDSLVIKEVYKDEAYKGALEYIAECLMVSGVQVWPCFLMQTCFLSRDSWLVEIFPWWMKMRCQTLWLMSTFWKRSSSE